MKEAWEKYISESRYGSLHQEAFEAGWKARKWVGLTDQEAQWLYENCRTPSNLIDMVEAKLKEKNS